MMSAAQGFCSSDTRHSEDEALYYRVQSAVVASFAKPFNGRVTILADIDRELVS